MPEPPVARHDRRGSESFSIARTGRPEAAIARYYWVYGWEPT
jgi:hypothetical protein